MTVTVHIDVSTPEGRELVLDLEKHKSVVMIEEHIEKVEGEETKQKTYSTEYAENLLWEKLNEHYGKDIREI